MIAIKSERELRELIEKMKSDGSKQELENYIRSSLNQNQQLKLNEILNDEKALNGILNSRKAKELLSRLTEDKNG